MPFIKSHSNYVLKSRHQDVSDGTIFERDITTIGGVNQFSPGQTPIYRSNNFIVTVRNDSKPSNQYNTSKWMETDSGTTWTLQTISNMVSDFEGEDDTKIVLKQDYYDFRDFAYYGSLTELFRASVTDIVARFPGELYVTDQHAYYTESYTIDFDRIEESVILGGNNYYYVSNPFGIDVHSEYKPADANLLKYFADGGYNNYQVRIGDSGEWKNIVDWKVGQYDPCQCVCKSFRISGDYNISSDGGTNITIGTYNDITCISGISASSNKDWVTVTSVSNGKIIANVLENEDINNDRTADITVTGEASDEGTCTKTYKLTQSKRIINCSCEDLTLGDTPSNWAYNSTASKTVSYTINETECIKDSDITVSSTNTWFSANKGNGVITITPRGENTTLSTKSDTITVTYNVTGKPNPCTKTFDVSQDPYVCGCEDLKLGETPSNWAYNSTASKTVTYTFTSTCVNADSISVTSNNNWFSVTNSVNGSNGVITISPSGENQTMSAINATITVKYKSNTEDCTPTFNVTQDYNDCDCNKLKVNGVGSIPCSGGTNILVGTYSGTTDVGGCIDKNTLSGTALTSGVSNIKFSNGNITANVPANTGNARPITISVKAKINNTICDCNNSQGCIITPNQEAKCCDCDDLSIECLEGCDGAKSSSRSIKSALRGLNITREGGNDDSSTGESKEELYRRVAKVVITDEDGVNYEIYAYLADNDELVYLSKTQDLHIRPRRPFLDKFFSECDNFERLLVNEDTGYKATFSVIRENDYGYYREFVPFQFPLGYGGYNLDATDYGFNEYTTKMVEIGEYYDENFTDNLWRSMTHEAIKNFDWTYTREYNEGDEEEFIFGGQRIQKALRIFAREFDEILSYINNIKTLNRVTYDERSNMPDYFLTDVVENEGWDVKLVYPYELTEYYYDKDNNRVSAIESKWEEGGTAACIGQLDNNIVIIDQGGQGGIYDIVREFSQNSTNKIRPYSKVIVSSSTVNGDILCDGYYIMCGNGEFVPCEYSSTTVSDIKYHYQKASGATTYDENALKGNGVVKNRIKSYTDETDWSYQDVNNEFLRRLKINSPYIWRTKGTIEGIEMILGMFGMKSRRWVEAHPQWEINCKYANGSGNTYDYDIREYTSFANRIEEAWDVIHQDYRINWVNSTKSITYDNRFVSNYSKFGSNPNMLTYQGIPVAFRDEYINNTTSGTAFIAVDSLENQITSGVSGTSRENAFLTVDGTPVVRRYLYPYFSNTEELDGHPYYQMDGGWLSNTITNSGGTTWNFQFDVDDNIVYKKYIPSGYTDESGFTIDNKPLFKETVRNIRRVDNINSLLSIPTLNLYNGVICYVTRIEKNSAVIDNIVYPIQREWYSSGATDSGHVVSYISLIKTDGYIRVGSNKFFDTTIIAYDIDGEEFNCDLEDKSDGYELKAYIIDKTEEKPSFICKEDPDGNYSISNFQILDNLVNSGYTNYFILDDVNYADVLAWSGKTTSGWTSGWRRLSEKDENYLKINTIQNYYNGNNPHNGNMIYDNGHEYFTYFKRLFKYAGDNNLFDERCYEDYFATLDNEIVKYGFSGLIDDNEDIHQYDSFLIPDTKIHYFGNYKTKKGESKSNGEINIDKVWIYGDNVERISGDTDGVGGFDVIYSGETSGVSCYNLSAYTDNGWVESYDSASTENYSNPYNPVSGFTSAATVIDEVTNQIVNNKIFDITFKLHTDKWYSKKGQEEIKYIDDIVMNYLTQMIPSTTILRIKYE